MNVTSRNTNYQWENAPWQIIILVIIVLAIGVVGWHDQYTQKARQTLEQDFGATFGPYPTNEQERLAVRPLVIKELIVRRAKLDAVEKETSRIWNQIYQDTKTKNDASVLTAALNEVERLESERPELQKHFWTACLTAFRAGFQNEAKVSRCEYEKGGIGFM